MEVCLFSPRRPGPLREIVIACVLLSARARHTSSGKRRASGLEAERWKTGKPENTPLNRTVKIRSKRASVGHSAGQEIKSDNCVAPLAAYLFLPPCFFVCRIRVCSIPFCENPTARTEQQVVHLRKEGG